MQKHVLFKCTEKASPRELGPEVAALSEAAKNDPELHKVIRLHGPKPQGLMSHVVTARQKHDEAMASAKARVLKRIESSLVEVLLVLAEGYDALASAPQEARHADLAHFGPPPQHRKTSSLAAHHRLTMCSVMNVALAVGATGGHQMSDHPGAHMRHLLMAAKHGLPLGEHEIEGLAMALQHAGEYGVDAGPHWKALRENELFAKWRNQGAPRKYSVEAAFQALLAQTST